MTQKQVERLIKKLETQIRRCEAASKKSEITEVDNNLFVAAKEVVTELKSWEPSHFKAVLEQPRFTVSACMEKAHRLAMEQITLTFKTTPYDIAFAKLANTVLDVYIKEKKIEIHEMKLRFQLCKKASKNQEELRALIKQQGLLA